MTSGKISSYYSLLNTAYQGLLKVKATAKDANGKILGDSLNLFVTKP